MSWSNEHRLKSIEIKRLKALDRAKLNNQPFLSNHALKRILLTAGEKYKCNHCNITEWKGKPINLDLDHINGDTFDNTLKNLRFLCPNCHSQTKTYKGRNVNCGKIKVSDDKLLKALNKTSNIRQALISVKLSPRGANYSRALKLLNSARGGIWTHSVIINPYLILSQMCFAFSPPAH